MRFARRVEPEWLDELSSSDPRAIRSRRDLRLINAAMFQSRILARLLRNLSPRPHRILELGAGDGTFMLTLAKRFAPYWRDITLVLLDRKDVVVPETRSRFTALGWTVETVTADSLDFLPQQKADSFDLVTANLFLHHFSDDCLRHLFASLARATSTFAACEPERARTAFVASRMLWALGCNDVTRHDASTSVRAGFRGRELSKIWAAAAQGAWNSREGSVLFTHTLFVSREGGGK
jgi:SAM-dependent methyltransferase